MSDDEFRRQVLNDLCDIKARQAASEHQAHELRKTIRILSQYVEKLATDEAA
jgi:hypothetical protein